MNPLVTNLLIGVVVALVAALATHFVSTRNIDQKIIRISKDITVEHVEHHKEALHQDSMYVHVENELKKHKLGCGLPVVEELKNTNGKLDRVTRALIWLVSAQGGNLKDLDLD